MEKMEVDEVVVDLSISSARSTSSPHQIRSNTPNVNNFNNNPQQHVGINNITQHHQQYMQAQPMVNSRRILRPRTEPRSYVESPDVLINGSLERPRTNGNLDYSSDSSEGEMPPLVPIKELTPTELKQRERGLRRLREELRAEEMKLVLLKKLKQSQQLKENVAVLPPSIPQSALPPTGLPSGLSITPTTVKIPPNKVQLPQASAVVHPRHPNSHKPLLPSGNVPTILRGQQPPPPRTSLHVPPISGSPLSSRGASLSVPQPQQRSNLLGRPPSIYPPGVKDLSPSVTITPAPPQPPKTASGLDTKGLGVGVCSAGQTTPVQEQERPRDDNQTPAQRQAAAKLALRKQLEKTLLQIPPPKPPPPEMHFIPNPSNTEFIYLIGLEHVVDFLTKETKIPVPPQPFSCSQCSSDFTPVWKWETKGKTRGSKVICEQCVTNNVKKALKAEHTNRLKTAFVKALQQEQEIEQRLAQNGVFTSSSPAPSPVTPDPSAIPKAATPSPVPRHAATPPAPPNQQQVQQVQQAPTPQPTPPPPPPPQARVQAPQQQAPPQPPQQPHPTAQDKYTQNAAAMQAIHQQLLRTLAAGAPPAHMLQFSQFFYPYQLAMAQAAASGKGGAPNLAELQRAAEMQRQYLLDMIPPTPGQRHWKT